MSEFAARIGRIRMKGGGADVRILPQQNRPYADEEDYRAAMVRNARSIADGEPLVGYLVLGIYPFGRTSIGFRYDNTNRDGIPAALLPTWIAEVFRRDIIVGREAELTFERMYEWRDA